MQRKRDSDSSRHLEPVRKLSQQLAKVEATPTPPQQHVEKRNDKIQLQAEVAQLCEQLEEARRKIKAQGQVATAVQKRFKDCLGQIQAGTLDKAQMTEDQNKKLAARNAELLELLQVERTGRESTLCCLQRALAETQRDLGTCEGALEARVRECDVTDQEKRREQERAAWLEGRLRESEDENAQLRESFHSLRVSLHYKDGEAATSPQRSQEAESQTPNIEETEVVLKLVESARQLQADNARLEEALKRQTDTVAELLEAQEAQLKRAVLEQQLVQEAQLERAEAEAEVLRGHLQEAQTRAEDRERESADLQKCFGDAFGKIRAEAAKIAASNQQLQELLEIEKAERKREMSAREQEISEREQEIAEREQERSKIESYVLQLQQELAEAKREALLYAAPSPGGSPEDYSKLEEEKLDLHRYIGRLEGTLKESEVKCVQSEQLISKLVGSLREKDHEVAASSQKLQEVFAASASMDRTIQLLRDSVLRLETDTHRQEEAAKEQAGRIAELGTEVDDAMIARRDLEERLSQEMQKQSSFSVNAQVELNEAEAALQAERKKSSEAQELQKDLQEQLEQGQSERLMLQQQLEDSQKRTKLKDQALKDMQDFICDTTRRLSQVNEQLVEEKSTDVVGLENVEDIDTGQDSILRQLQNILAKMQTKLSSCEQSLEEKTLCCKDLALKNQCMLEDVDRLQRMLQQSEDKLIQAESRNVHLQRSMDSDKEVIAFLQKSQEVVSVSTDTAETMESLGQLKSENMILEETLRQQASRIVELEREVDEAAEVKKYLEERLDQEIERQNSLIVNTQVEVSDAEVAQPDQGQKSNKAQKQQVDLQAQLDSAKTDRLTLRKHLREAQKISELRDLAVMDMQRCMNDTLTGMRAYSQERIELAERRSTVFASEIAELQEQLERVETDRDGIQKELAEARRKLSLHEESLEEKTSGRRDIEERPVTQGDVTALKDVLQRTDDKNVKLGRDNFNLKCALKDKELKVLALSQKLRESASAADSDRAAQVESLRLLESENLRLEEALKQQTGRIAELEKEVAEAAGVKRDLEEQLSRDVERRGSLSIDTRVAASGGTVVALQNEQGRFGAAEKPQEEEQVKILQQQLNEAEEMTELEDPGESDV
ncbi:cingulin-like protein 1 [Anguilla anguilla]|uniref:cingulin-like protein 1 n=1 Tax=Anguilla anguilla TaxID=7936 RepID=UPI0015B22386|nr:cingulin-like protein 1 [Anguilla anguilla]